MPKPSSLYLNKSGNPKPVVRTCLILFLAFIFSLQQFSALADIHSVKPAKEERSSGFHSGNFLVQPQFTHSLPFTENGKGPDAELTEEDEIKNNHWYLVPAEEKQAGGEFRITACIKSRFQQIAQSIHNRQPVPFFILYQNRKSFLV